MNSWHAALLTETLKARRSRTPWLTAAGFSLAPLVGGLFMLIIKDPAWARRAGLLSNKAQLAAGIADWPTYLNLLAQAVAIGGFLVFGIVATWVFGREFSDRTVKDLLALPTPRETVVSAKFIVVAAWCLLLALVVVGLGVVVGSLVGLPGWSASVLRTGIGEIGLAAVLTVLLVTPVALVASVGRGYMAPISAMVLVLMLAQVFAATGWGVYFPWAVPGLGSGAAGPDAADLGVISYVLVVIVGGLGVVGTLLWWQRADHT
ncbi:MAG TPA: ABC transporter permease [Chloroflexota bacterium]|nr:ABC transporter permease [Chloroflexota bacterium]